MKNMQKNNDFDLAHQSLKDALKISFRILQIAMTIVVISFLCSGIYVVNQHESAMVLRFGKVIGTPADRIKTAGLHWAWPYPIDKIVKIPTSRIQSLTITDFQYFERTRSSKTSPPYENSHQRKNRHRHKNSLLIPAKSLKPGIDGYIICGDVNIVHANWVLRYKIVDPYYYHLNIQDETKLLRTIFNNSVIATANGLDVDTVLRKGIEEFRRKVENRTQAFLRKIVCGIELQRIDIEKVNPPQQVTKAFEDVIQAEQEHSQKINEAKSFAARLCNEAQGNASKILSQAEAYRTNTIEETKSDAQYIEEIIEEFNNNPEMFMFLAHQQVLKNVLSKVESKYIFDTTENRKRELRLLLNKN